MREVLTVVAPPLWPQVVVPPASLAADVTTATTDATSAAAGVENAENDDGDDGSCLDPPLLDLDLGPKRGPRGPPPPPPGPFETPTALQWPKPELAVLMSLCARILRVVAIENREANS